MRRQAILRRMTITLGPALAAAALSACAGGSSGAAAGGGGDPQRATMLASETFGANPKATSGKISGGVTVSVQGVPHFSDPVVFTASGSFSDSAGTALPSWDESLSIRAHGLLYGAGTTSSADKVYLNVGTTAYPLPDRIVATMRSASSEAQNGITRTVAPLSIRPELWTRNLRIVGNEQLAGVDVVHISSEIDAARFFVDAGKFAHTLTALQITSLTGLPRAIGPTAQAALVRSVTAAKGDLYTGSTDHVLRRAALSMTLAVAPADRKLLGGMTSATITATLDVTEVGAPQQISVLPDQQPYQLALGLLKAAAFSNRAPGERGK